MTNQERVIGWQISMMVGGIIAVLISALLVSVGADDNFLMIYLLANVCAFMLWGAICEHIHNIYVEEGVKVKPNEVVVEKEDWVEKERRILAYENSGLRKEVESLERQLSSQKSLQTKLKNKVWKKLTEEPKRRR